MTEEIIIAGFGGQGVLSMGKILAYSGVMQNKEPLCQGQPKEFVPIGFKSFVGYVYYRSYFSF